MKPTGIFYFPKCILEYLYLPFLVKTMVNIPKEVMDILAAADLSKK
jgi:hypothetical protein